MLPNPEPDFDRPPPGSDSAWLESAVKRFERAWSQGPRPPIDDYLPAGDRRRLVLVELVHIDLELRLKAGEAARVEEYLNRYPELAGDRAAALELIAVEYELRRRGEPGLVLDDYLQRFPQYRGDLSEQIGQATVVAGGSPRRPADLPWQIPLQVAGYDILGVLGRGGMGVVYRARQRALNRVVALKMILAAEHAGPTEVSRFRREAEMVARLQCPHVVQIYEVGEQAGRHFFAMEFIEGGSLDRQLTGTPQPARAAAQLVETLARAMHHAHQHDIIHRDLKPANILLQTTNGTEPTATKAPAAELSSCVCSLASGVAFIPKITDFGVAKLLGGAEASPTRSGDVLGTPSYMAPEQAAGTSALIGPATDVYGLGSILYELLTGRPPFKAETAVETLLQVQFADPVSPSRLQPRLPRDLVTICLRCLQKEPRQRYPSALALAEDLRRFLDGRPIQARPVGVLARAVKWARRRPVVAALLGAVVVVAALGFGGIVWQWRRAERSLDQAQTSLYFNRIALTHHEWLAYNVARADELLAECPPEQRHWEWHYLRGLCTSNLLTLHGHTEGVSSVAFSPNGRLLASATGPWVSKKPGEIKIWDVRTGQELVNCVGHTRGVSQVAFSPDGRSLASASLDGTVRCWDVQTGKEQLSLRGHTGWVMSVAFSPDGRRLASGGSDHKVIVWDLATREPALRCEKHIDMVFSVAFSPDGRRLASGSRDWKVMVWDTSEGQGGQAAAPLHTLGGIVDVRCLAVSPDGRHLAAGGYDYTLKVWDLGNPREVREVFTNHAHASPLCHVAFRPDGQQVVSTDAEGTVRFWDVRTGIAVGSLRGHSGAVTSVAFSPDGLLLATASADRTVRIWDATTEQQALTLNPGGHRPLPKGPVAFGSDSQLLAAATSDGPIQVWDMRTAEIVHLLGEHGPAAASVTFSPDGQRLAAAFDALVKVWDLRTKQEVASRRGDAHVLSVAFSADGQRLWVASGDRSVKVWDALSAAEPRSLGGPMSQVTCGTFSGDGQCLAVAADAGTVRVWETATGREVGLLACGAEVTSMAFSLDRRRLAVATADNTVTIHELAGRRCTVICRGHTAEVRSLAFSADGQRLASTSYDLTLKLWDTRTGQEAITLRGHEDLVLSVAVSADGQRLASASNNGKLMVWVAGEQPAEDKAARRQGKDPWASAGHRREAMKAAAARRPLAVVFHLSPLIDAAPGQRDLHVQRGRAFAELGQWDQAARDFAVAFAPRSGDLRLRNDQALVFLAVGDQGRYRELCAGILADFGATASADVANLAAWTCVLGPSATEGLTQPLRLAEKAVAGERSYGYLNTLGIALYRAEQLDLAIQRLNEAITVHGEGSVADWLFLAMAHHRRGQADEAGKWLEKADHWIDTTEAARAKDPAAPGPPWSERLEIQLFRREAETLLKGAKP